MTAGYRPKKEPGAEGSRQHRARLKPRGEEIPRKARWRQSAMDISRPLSHNAFRRFEPALPPHFHELFTTKLVERVCETAHLVR